MGDASVVMAWVARHASGHVGGSLRPEKRRDMQHRRLLSLWRWCQLRGDGRPCSVSREQEVDLLLFAQLRPDLLYVVGFEPPPPTIDRRAANCWDSL